MAQEKVWEKEYQDSKLVTKKDQPQNDVLRFYKYLKKEHKLNLSSLKVLDLGCGTGRNSNYLAELGNEVVGLEISATALEIAKKRAGEKKLKTEYIKQSIGKPYPFKDESFDLILDITSSNSLDEQERLVYLNESRRVLKKGGFFLVRALCKDGDKNAQKLLKSFPGQEPDTYRIKELGLVERVFSRADFVELYKKYFHILQLIKKTGYSRFNNRSYKRNYWLAYLTK